MQKISPFLWFDGTAEEAATFYVSVFPDSGIDSVHRNEDGSALVVNFRLQGQSFLALNGGPMYKLSEACSFMIHCDGQAEVDHYWNLLTPGGEIQACGWLKDKFGLSWQVTPVQFSQLMSAGTPAQAGAVMQAMMQMTKFDIPALQAAFDGAS